MTPERINLVIAQHLPHLFGIHQESKEIYLRTNPIQTCDICHDLNAMNTVEWAGLRDSDLSIYEQTLVALCDLPSYVRGVVCAGPNKRAEAFLRTVGKWEDK